MPSGGVKHEAGVKWYVRNLEQNNRLTGYNVRLLASGGGLNVYSPLTRTTEVCERQLTFPVAPMFVTAVRNVNRHLALMALVDARVALYGSAYPQTFDDVVAMVGESRVAYGDADYLHLCISGGNELVLNESGRAVVVDNRPLCLQTRFEKFVDKIAREAYTTIRKREAVLRSIGG